MADAAESRVACTRRIDCSSWPIAKIAHAMERADVARDLNLQPDGRRRARRRCAARRHINATRSRIARAGRRMAANRRRYGALRVACDERVRRLPFSAYAR